MSIYYTDDDGKHWDITNAIALSDKVSELAEELKKTKKLLKQSKELCNKIERRRNECARDYTAAQQKIEELESAMRSISGIATLYKAEP